MSELTGTFACPICGKDTPHSELEHNPAPHHQYDATCKCDSCRDMRGRLQDRADDLYAGSLSGNRSSFPDGDICPCGTPEHEHTVKVHAGAEGAAVQPPAPSDLIAKEIANHLWCGCDSSNGTEEEAIAFVSRKLMRIRESSSRAQAAEITRLRALLDACVEELNYIQAVENCTSGLCATSRGKELIAKAAALAGGSSPPSALTIKKAQDTNFEKYRDTIAARGPDRNWMRFTEEVGELAKAIRRDDKPNMEEESADVFAWLITVAAIHGINLEAAYIAKYGSAECFRCEQVKCACPEIGVAPPSPPPTEPAA